MNPSGFLTEDDRCALGLTSLGAGPRRIRAFLDGYSPADAWDAIVRGTHPADEDHVYREKATNELVEIAATACERARASVLVLGDERYPAALAVDPEAPAVLFSWGEPRLGDRLPRVAVVGTRSATRYGLGVASELGQGLAEAGVVVISGLARGIDSAAHAGTLKSDGARALVVLGKALDGRVPPAQDALRRAVAERGAVLSELPPGTTGAPAWWFAIRNRVMAGMAHLVVVVECHPRGGALHTVRYASKRGVPIAAVPGSVRSPASAGTNSLLVGGAAVVRDADDVIAVLERTISNDARVVAPRALRTRSRRERAEHREAASLGATETRVLSALDQDPASLDAVVLRSGLSLGDVALALERLSVLALAEGEAGWWSRPRR